MDPLDGDNLFTITTQSEWIVLNSNSAIVTAAVAIENVQLGYQHYCFLIGPIVDDDYESPLATLA